MIHRFLLVAGLAGIMGPLALQAADFSSEHSKKKKKEDRPGDWCECLQEMGVLYDVKKKKNPYVQKVEIFGRYQQQWIYSDGSDQGRDFSGHGQELRRFRIGASVEFFDRWKIHGRINLEDGGFNDTVVRHDNFDELIIRYESKDFLFFNEPTIGYGLTKIDFGGEWYTTSKEIKTVERSNLSNLYSPNRATGFFFAAEVEDFDVVVGVFSSREHNYALADWDGGRGYFASIRTKIGKGKLRADILYVDATEEEDEIFGFDWATSLSYDKKVGDWNLFVNGTYGRFDAGDIYGIVVMPSTFLIEERLEAVFRYQWANSTGMQLRPGSRTHTSVRSVAEADGIRIARGDQNHSIYAGLNYHFCEDNLKLMTGVEYETLTGRVTDTEATTLWGALRFFF
ncbi:MAG: porin [Akkermansiaceae bacterium]